MIGKTVGHYEIIEKIGEGGMGVVYRAEDTRLKRTVALKFLPQDLTRSAEARERFIHEAQAASALDHPNICTIYEIDETDEGQVYIVMGLYEGQTLREKISERPLKLEDAIDITSQIAQGLAKAHEQKIIHRDIKPANIFITNEGQVKVLDFGVAKLAGSTKLTLTGTTLGTVSYMAPEQAKGDEADHKADIWSLGILMYEMLTGQQPFRGEHEQAIIYSILNEEPEPITSLRTGIPIDLEWIVQKALRKDPKQRYQHIDEIPVDLGAVSARDVSTSGIQAGTLPSVSQAAPMHSERTVQWSIPTLVIILSLLTVGIFTGILKIHLGSRSEITSISGTLTKHFVETTLSLPAFGIVTGPVLAISPDGSTLAFLVSEDGTTQLYLRKIDQPGAVPIQGTEGATVPFFSPDGRWVGYFNENDFTLNRASLLGGPPELICNALSVRGASWGPGDTIFFAPSVNSGLFAVPARGGIPEPVTEVDIERGEKSHRFPEVLPSGSAVLFTVGMRDMTTWDTANIAVFSLKTLEIKELIRGGTCPKYLPTGHILYARSGALYAVPFDEEKLVTTGDEFRLDRQVVTSEGFGGAQFSISREGTLIYVAGGSDAPENNMVWVDRRGNIEEVGAQSHLYISQRISPDGTQIVVSVIRANDEVWVYDLVRGMMSRLIYGDGDNTQPCWSHDGSWIYFISNRTGPALIFRKALDESAGPEQVLPGKYDHMQPCISSDGRYLVFVEVHPETNADIWVYDLEGQGDPEIFLQTPNNEQGPALSPDNRWLAYTSDEFGQQDVYVRSFPDGERKLPISTGGASRPRWSADGEELFYLSGQRMMVVSVTPDASNPFSTPGVLFESPQYRTYQWNMFDVSQDGERFLMVEAIKKEPADQIEIVLNWFEELKRLKPDR